MRTKIVWILSGSKIIEPFGTAVAEKQLQSLKNDGNFQTDSWNIHSTSTQIYQSGGQERSESDPGSKSVPGYQQRRDIFSLNLRFL